MPWRRRSSTMCSMQGLPTMGTIGFGWFDVSGRRRVPSPPAITTALTPASRARSRLGHLDPPAAADRPPRRGCVEHCSGDGEADADPEDDERPVRALAGDDDERDRGIE